MTINPTKIRPGDELTVAVRALAKPDDDGEVYVRLADVDDFYLSLSTIVSHTPAPREFKVGDRVEDGFSVVGEIIAIHDGRAWVDYRDDDGLVWPLSDLSHVEGEPG